MLCQLSNVLSIVYGSPFTIGLLKANFQRQVTKISLSSLFGVLYQRDNIFVQALPNYLREKRKLLLKVVYSLSTFRIYTAQCEGQCPFALPIERCSATRSTSSGVVWALLREFHPAFSQ